MSNREDHILLKNFFSHLKNYTGPISPEWFMSDMAEQYYYNSWVHVFGGRPKKLLCTWHVDRAWRKNLHKICDKNMQKEVYHMLRVLLEEMDSIKFHKLLDEILKEWKNNELMSDFLEYFQLHYGQRPQEWAGCYRKRASVNTNMYAESFHRVLKYIYLKGKVNKRMDVCIAVLMRYARDKAFDRIMKFEKGKSTKRTSAIMNRHKASLLLPTALVHAESNNQWTVQSSTEANTTYTVEKVANDSCQNCWMRCHICQVCVHAYICTCHDSLLHGGICKHVHLVVRFTGVTHTNDSKAEKIPSEIFLASVQNKARVGGNDEIKNRLQMKLFNIATGISTINDKDTLLDIEKYLKSCISLINLTEHTKHEPPNKKITPQRNFYTTKRKRQTLKVRLAKPTIAERVSVVNRLLQSARKANFANIGEFKLCAMHKLNNEVDFVYTRNTVNAMQGEFIGESLQEQCLS